MMQTNAHIFPTHLMQTTNVCPLDQHTMFGYHDSITFKANL